MEGEESIWDVEEMLHSKTDSDQSIMCFGTSHPFPTRAELPLHFMESMGLEAVGRNFLRSGRQRASVVASPYDSWPDALSEW